MQKGTATAISILDAATQHLIEDGQANFSLRGVAKRAGISVGNLTYHFRTKRELIHALVNQVGAFYVTWLTNLETSKGTPTDRLRSAVTYLIQNSATGDTSHLFRELWAMALHDERVEASLSQMYRAGYEVIRKLLLDVNPNLTDDKIRTAVTLIGLISEGSCVLNSERYDFISTPDEVVDTTMASVLDLIGEPRSSG